ncbi:autotransporter domain-containing protein, partial [Zavarzinia sp.]|uniref:autotransporter domain-containing protein n=1 Tax=Zavarzinia sp. TaxID=2027920 RepID=UPI0035620CCD
TTQVDDYLAEHPTTPSDQLYMIGPAYNDYYAYHQRDPSVPAENQEAMMERLYAAGARDFAIFAYGGESDFGSAYSKEIVERSNRFQREHPGSKVYVVDFDRGIAEVKRNPEKYGFSDNFTPCWSDGLYLDACPDDRLYYDSVHPTRTGHQLVADFYYATIASGYQGPREIARLPEMARLASMGPAGDIAGRIVERRLGGIFDGGATPGAASGSTIGGLGPIQLWVRSGIGFGSRDGNDVAQDYSYSSEHLVAGADVALTSQVLVGLAAGLSALQGDYEGVGGTVNLYSYALAAYAALAEGPLTLAAQVGYALDRYRDLDRATGMPENPTATGSPDGNTLYARLSAAAEVVLDTVTLVPQVALTYAASHVDGFQESGSVLFDFTVADQDVTSLRSEIGVGLRHVFDSALLGPIQAEAGLAWEHEFADGDREVLGVFPNGSEQFVQSRFEKADAAKLSLGMRFAVDSISTGATLRLTYDGRLGSDGDDHLVAAALLVPLG